MSFKQHIPNAITCGNLVSGCFFLSKYTGLLIDYTEKRCYNVTEYEKLGSFT